MKSKPSDWDFVCYYCGCRARKGDCGGLPHLVTHGTIRALWGHEWAAVAWMASAEYEGFRALSDEIEASCEGGAGPTRKTFRKWIDDYTRGLDPIWP